MKRNYTLAWFGYFLIFLAAWIHANLFSIKMWKTRMQLTSAYLEILYLSFKQYRLNRRIKK